MLIAPWTEVFMLVKKVRGRQKPQALCAREFSVGGPRPGRRRGRPRLLHQNTPQKIECAPGTSEFPLRMTTHCARHVHAPPPTFLCVDLGPHFVFKA